MFYKFKARYCDPLTAVSLNADSLAIEQSGRLHFMSRTENERTIEDEYGFDTVCKGP